MSRLIQIQTNFSSGEIDPLLRSRIDLSQYSNAAERLENVLVQPQGGVRRRPGAKYISEITAYNPQNGTRCVPFEFNVNDSYMLVFCHQRMLVFKNQVQITNISGSGFDALPIPVLTSDILSTMCWTQSADTLIITHEDMPPLKIVRGLDDQSWSYSAIDFVGIPRYAFDLSVFQPKYTITPSEVSGTVRLTASAYTGETGTLQSGTSTSVVLKAAGSTVDDIFNGMCIHITAGAGAGQYAKITDYVGATHTATVFPAFAVAPDATSQYKVEPYAPLIVGQYVNAEPQGRGRIISYISDTEIDIVTEIPFASTDAITTGNHDVECFYEDVWSTTRGWPRTCTFHEGRLFFGGSKSRPSTVWASKVGQFFDFYPDQAYDDDALEATLDTNSLNVITDMLSGRDLQVFTTGGEFYVPQQGLDPITPSNFFVRAVSRNGSRTGIRVQQLQSGTLYIQRQGKALNEFQYSDTTLSYISTSISLLSSHLINDPIELALRKATSTEESDTLLMLNGNGELTVYSILRQQNVVAPTRFTTNGDFVDVGVDIEDIYVVTKRTFDGTDKYFVEVFDSNTFTDCSFSGGAASGVTGLPHEGASLQVIADGNVLADETVSSGEITFERPSASSYEVGLGFDVLIKTMPVEPKLSVGTRLSFKKRIVEVNALLYETQHLTINGVLVPIRSFDTAGTLDASTIEFTGTKTVNGLLGFSKDAQITVGQNLPLKLTLLGLDYKLSVYGGS